MKDMCCIDAFSPTSSSEIKAYFMENLKPIMDENRDIIFLCIGNRHTDEKVADRRKSAGSPRYVPFHYVRGYGL